MQELEEAHEKVANEDDQSMIYTRWKFVHHYEQKCREYGCL